MSRGFRVIRTLLNLNDLNFMKNIINAKYRIDINEAQKIKIYHSKSNK